MKIQLTPSVTVEGTEIITNTVRHREALLHYTFDFKDGRRSFTTLKHSLDSCRDALLQFIRASKKK